MKNIVLASDDNFVQHCAVTMISILKNNLNVHFYLLTEGLSENNIHTLYTLVEINGGKLDVIIVNSSIVRKFPMPKGVASHISIATYYRLFVAELLPKDISKIIYLDCDMIIRQSIEDLWNTDISGYALAAVYQYNEWADDNDTWKRLNIPKEFGYFNAGTLLINLSYWREKHVTKRFIDFISKYGNFIIFHDQDTMNAVLFNETLPLSCRWNVLTFFFSNTLQMYHFPKNLDYYNEFTKEVKYSPAVIHFVSRPKPWEYGCDHTYKKEYYYYLSFTPWKNWKPKFNFKCFINYILLKSISPIIILMHPLTKKIKQFFNHVCPSIGYK